MSYANGGHPRTNRLLHTKQHTTHKKHITSSPWSSQAIGFQRLQFYRWVSNPRMLHYQSQSLQHGNVLYIDDTNFFFNYLTIILCAAAQCSHWLMVSFYRLYHAFFCATALKWCALTPAIRWYLIWQCCQRTHLVLGWFRTGGGGGTIVRNF